MTHDDYRETLASHALASSDAGEGQALESHLGSCLSCSSELAELREAAANLVLLAPPIAPSPDSLARLLAALDENPRRSTQRTGRGVRERRRWRPLVLATRLAVAAVIAALTVSQWKLLGRLDDAYRRMTAMREIGRFVTSANVSVVPLWGREGVRGAHAKIAYDHTTGRFVFLSSRMPPLPEGQVYRLWVISERIRPVGAVSLEAPDGVVPSPPRGDEPFFFAISIEPAAEHDEPTGPLVLMSAAQRPPDSQSP